MGLSSHTFIVPAWESGMTISIRIAGRPRAGSYAVRKTSGGPTGDETLEFVPLKYVFDCDSTVVMLVQVRPLNGDGPCAPFEPLAGVELVPAPAPPAGDRSGVDGGSRSAALSPASGAGFAPASGSGAMTTCPVEVNDNGSISALNSHAASSGGGPSSGCGSVGGGGGGGVGLDQIPGMARRLAPAALIRL